MRIETEYLRVCGSPCKTGRLLCPQRDELEASYPSFRGSTLRVERTMRGSSRESFARWLILCPGETAANAHLDAEYLVGERQTCRSAKSTHVDRRIHDPGHRAEVMIERSVFLHENHNVLDVMQSASFRRLGEGFAQVWREEIGCDRRREACCRGQEPAAVMRVDPKTE